MKADRSSTRRYNECRREEPQLNAVELLSEERGGEGKTGDYSDRDQRERQHQPDVFCGT